MMGLSGRKKKQQWIGILAAPSKRPFPFLSGHQDWFTRVTRVAARHRTRVFTSRHSLELSKHLFGIQSTGCFFQLFVREVAFS